MKNIIVSFNENWLIEQSFRPTLPIDELAEKLLTDYTDCVTINDKELFYLSFIIRDESRLTQNILEEIISQIVKEPNWRELTSIEVDNHNISPEPNNKSTFSMDELAEKYVNLYNTLTSKILGQDMAVMQFVRECFQAEMYTSKDHKGPKSSFLFAGPPGVGKTLLAGTAADNLGIAYKMFNMSGYADEKSYIDLVGVSKSFKSAHEGDLVKFARENPNGLIIFDEIEKAHITTLRLFLQILDRGILHNDFLNEDTDFSGNIIIFTSNAGKSIYGNKEKKLSSLPKDVILDAIRNEKTEYGTSVFPPELCSRFGAGNIIVFDHMDIHTLNILTRKNFDNVCNTLNQKYGFIMSYDRRLPLLFLLNLGAKADARIVNSQCTKFLLNEIYELARHVLPISQTMSDIRNINFELSEDMSEEVKQILVPTEKAEILLLADSSYKGQINLPASEYSVILSASIEESKAALDRDISLILVDPYFNMKESSDSILGLDDLQSSGIDFLTYLTETEIEVPIYLISKDAPISETDRNTFLQKGISGFVAKEDDSELDINKIISEIIETIKIQNSFTELTGKGLILNYETSQILSDNGNELIVQFYNIRKKTAIDTESQKKIVSNAERPNTRLSEVIGAKKAKEELSYFLNYLKEPKKFILNGGKRPKGILLYGPPGTGKTMLARAMAGESSMTFLSTSATELMSKFVGESEKNIRDLFATAKRYAPSIIFIDEIDAIGKTRTGSESGKATEDMLNALLTEMDGFTSGNIKKPVFVLAATNYGVKDTDDGVKLDPALVRRFDNSIYVDLPNEDERKQYLNLKLLNKNNEITEEAINNLAKRTTGKSIAILENIINLANRNALKSSKPLDDNILYNALEEYNYGDQHTWNDEYYKQVAIHEASHAYICYLSGEIPSYITIVSRGNFGGYMQHDNDEKQPNHTKTQLLWNIRTSLAGRIGEKVFFGEELAINTGASSDLENASRIALNMICRLGMNEGQLFAIRPEEITKSPMASVYINQANDILLREYAECEKLIIEGRDKIQSLADKLVNDNYMTGDELVKILNQ